MTSLKPYLIRSIYEWIIDNQFTPHLLVDAEKSDHAVLPLNFVKNGQIVLNMRPEAIDDLMLGNEEIQFNARFSGEPMRVIVPVSSVLALYAQENGKGMVFDQDEPEDEKPPPPPEKKPTRPMLRVVK